MKVILAEKPSVAKTIASFLKANTRRDGYFEGNGYIVTYAFGHLVSLYDMKDYDKRNILVLGKWRIFHLSQQINLNLKSMIQSKNSSI